MSPYPKNGVKPKGGGGLAGLHLLARGHRPPEHLQALHLLGDALLWQLQHGAYLRTGARAVIGAAALPRGCTSHDIHQVLDCGTRCAWHAATMCAQMRTLCIPLCLRQL